MQVIEMFSAQEEGLDITRPSVYTHCADATIAHVFRSCRDEPMPLLDERIAILRESGKILLDVRPALTPSIPLTPRQKFDGSFVNVVKQANGSAVRLVRLLLEHFPSFRDEPVVDGRNIRIWKRAQICVGEIWAALEGQGVAAFDDIDQLTM
jgi:hypothetical protein